jgi:CubicO group peptidase (beta-lactamase class C family)
VGHLGFTGTSVWMDLERDVTVVFLTNRIHTTRNNDKIKVFRPRVHDAVMEALVFNRVKGGNRESL